MRREIETLHYVGKKEVGMNCGVVVSIDTHQYLLKFGVPGRNTYAMPTLLGNDPKKNKRGNEQEKLYIHYRDLEKDVYGYYVCKEIHTYFGSWLPVSLHIPDTFIYSIRDVVGKSEEIATLLNPYAIA